MITTTGLQRIHQISLRTQDTARAVAFYRDALGLKPLFEAPPQLAFFDCGGVRLLLSPAEPEFDHQGSLSYCAVRDSKATHTAWTVARGTFRSERRTCARLTDPARGPDDVLDNRGE